MPNIIATLTITAPAPSPYVDLGAVTALTHRLESQLADFAESARAGLESIGASIETSVALSRPRGQSASEPVGDDGGQMVSEPVRSAA